MRTRWFNLLVLLSLVLGLLPVTAAQAVSAAAPITQPVAQGTPDIEVESALRNQLAADETTGYLIYFKDKPDLSPAYKMNWIERGRFVANALNQTALRSQANVRAYLDARGIAYKAFWIQNMISVESSNRATFDGLMKYAEIKTIRQHRQLSLIEPQRTTMATSAPQAIEPNILHVLADQVWTLGYTGEGLVVANVDTGVRYSHNALVNQYRGNLGGSFDHNYNWWDPYGDHPTSPADDNGHGTHTMGTTVGDDGGANRIGMAPGAQWMACRACNTNDCTDTALLECAQFIAAPWDLNKANANPDKRPNVVNNSWGDCSRSYDPWYQDAVDAWLAAGIYPVFSNGNNSNCGYPAPPGLNTVGNPARYGNVTGVGSSGRDNGQYAPHSNWGPTDNPDTVNPHPGWADLKPQVLAPGVNIRSSVNSGDSAYQGGWSGTSMSAPHVTGLIALMWSAAPCLIGDYATTETIIENTAIPIAYDDGTGGGAHVPNQAAGWGEINALAAVQAAAASCGDSTITGEVLDAATNATIEGASIVATNAAGTVQRKATSNAAGVYALNVFSDTYTLTASRYGYQTTVIPGVVATTGATTTQHIAMTPAAFYEVSGRVTDAVTGWPLYAHISVTGDPVGPAAPDNSVWTDPATGAYSLMLAEDVTYTFAVEAWVAGYNATTGEVGPLTDDAPNTDFALQADMGSCAAPGYEKSTTPVLTEGFESPTFPPGGWRAYNRDGGGTQWERSTTQSYSGAASAAHLYSVAGTQDGWLVMPSVTIPGGEMLELSFWEYTQFVSWYQKHSLWACTTNCTTPPTNWTQITEFGAPVASWRQQQTVLGAYGGQTVYLAFRYEGNDADSWYVDHVTLNTFACEAPTNGGLVVGNVYDGNYPTVALNGATVVNAVGGETTAVATPLDPAVDDGFYTLFAPSGAQVFTATMKGYGPGVATVPVVSGDAVAQDFQLPAGLLDATPDGIAVTVELGYTAARTLTLANTGNLDVAFEIAEKETGFGPLQAIQITLPARVTSDNPLAKSNPIARPTRDAQTFILNNVHLASAATYNVLILTPDIGSGGGDISMLLAALAPFTDLTVTVWDPDTDGEPSVAELSAFDVVIVGNDIKWNNMDKTVVGDNLAGYIDAGGKVIEGLYIQSYDDWGFAGRYITDGYSPFTSATDDIWDPDTMNILDSGHPVMNGATTVNDNWGHQDPGLRAGASLLANWNTSGYNYVAVNDNVVAFNQLLHHDSDWSGDVGMILHNAVLWLGSGGDVPWLSEAPVMGAVAATGSTAITVDFDAAYVDQPGEYHAELIVTNDTPYGKFSVPVTMTVTSPQSWGKLTGAVIGLGVCDGDPAPLEKAEVLVESAATGQTWRATTGADGKYHLWLDRAHSPLTVTVTAPNYHGQVTGVVVRQGQTTVVDFDLRILLPCLSYNPADFDVTLPMGDNTVELLTLSNTGAGAAEYEMVERPGGFIPVARMRVSAVSTPRERLAGYDPDATTTKGILSPGGTSSIGILAAGDVLAQWNTGLGIPWGTGYDMVEDAVWLGDPLESYDYEFATDGTPTGRTVAVSFGGSWAGDIAYNPNTGMFWQVNVGGDNCIYEWNPASGVTGNSICGAGWTATSQRGLAYDPTTDTFFIGGWNDNNVYRIDNTGAVIEQWNLGLDISGLAYNFKAGYLFIIENNATDTITVFDVASGSVVDTFTATGFGDYSGAGLAIDCNGNLWAANQNDLNAYLIDSGVPANLCAGISDSIPWLTETPVSGTIAADTDSVVDLTFDAGVPETMQPGTYYGALKVAGNAANTVPNIPVTLTVTAPASWGKVAGVVTGLGYCDVATPTLLEKAEVTIVSGVGVEWLLETGPDGAYQLWLDAAYSPVTITVAYPDHLTQVFTNVVVTAGGTVVRDAALRWAMPCLTVDPDLFDVTVTLGTSTTVPFTLTNAGAGDATFDLTEANGGMVALHTTFNVAAAPLMPVESRRIELSMSNAAPSAPSVQAAPWASSGPVELVLDDGSAEDALGLTAGGQFLWLNRFTPDPDVFPFTLDQISILFLDTATVGEAIEIIVWEDTDGDGDPATGANLLYTADEAVLYNNSTTWNNYALSVPVMLNGPGDVLIGVVNRGAVGTHPAALDEDASQGRSWVGLYSGDPPEPPTLPPDYAFAVIDDLGFPGNWVVRGSGMKYVSAPIPWLSEEPVSGTVGADAAFVVDLTFDASAAVTEVTQPGEYFGTLFVNSNDPVNKKIAVPVTMTVIPPATWGKLTGVVTGLGYCDADPAPLAGADVLVESWMTETAMVPVVTTLLSESFEGAFPPAGWVAHNVDGGGSQWARSTARAHTGSASALHNYSSGMQDGWLVTPPVDIAGGATAELSFWEYTAYPGDYYKHSLWACTSGCGTPPANWTEVAEFASPTAAWRQQTVNLSAYAGQTVYLAFRYEGTFADAWYVDDVLLVETLVSPMDVPISWSLTTDISGTYQVWLDEMYSPVTITVSYPNHAKGEANVTVTGQNTTTHDFDLRWLVPCVAVDPLALHATLELGATATEPLTLTNTGAADAGWQIVEAGSGVVWLTESPLTGTLVANTGEQVVDVNFDASQVAQPGDYYVNLRINSNDPTSPFVVPVTMTVTPPASWGQLTGQVSSTGRCDVNLAPLAGAGVLVESWLTDVNTVTVSLLEEGFEGTTFPPAGWAAHNVDGSGSQWARSIANAHTGSASALHNFSSAGMQDGWLVTPAVTVPTAGTPELTFWEYTAYPGDYYKHSLWVCTGGCDTPPANWTEVTEFGAPTAAWRQQTVDLSAYAGQTVYLAFRYEGNFADAWYVDDVSVSYEAQAVIPVYTFSAATDAAGMYSLWMPADSYTVTVTAADHLDDFDTVAVIAGDTASQNFTLTWLGPCVTSIEPSAMEVTVTMGMSATLPLTMTNAGAGALEYQMKEKPGGFIPVARMRVSSMSTPRERLAGYDPDATTTKGILSPGGTSPIGILAAGDVLAQWNTGLGIPWGTGYDMVEDTVWLGDPLESYDYEFATDGTPTGRTVAVSFGGSWAGDIAYNPNTGMFWQVNVGGDNCIYEWNPASGVTGNSICGAGWTTVSQRGLAYDPTTDTFFIGGWNDNNVYRIDNTGAVIEQWNLGLDISGLAYNFKAGYLFIIENSATDAITVFDVASGSVVDTFTVTGFGNYVGAGLAIDCNGNLWAANQDDLNAYLIDSGVPASLCADIPWLFEDPESGAVPPATAGVADITFDAGVPEVTQPGDYFGLLVVNNSDPVWDGFSIPVTMHVTLPDTYGQITGTVMGLGPCDDPATAEALKGAVVTVESATQTWALLTDAAGGYALWLDEAHSPVTITAAMAGYVTGVVTGVQVVSGTTTVRDVALRPDAPCATVTPLLIEQSLTLGMSTTLPITIGNTGAYTLAWTLSDGGVAWLDQDPLAGATAPNGGTSAVTVTLDAGGFEQPGVYTAALLVNNDSARTPLTVPVTLTVEPPATWGRLAGLVQGLGYCNATTVPLESAVVFVESATPQPQLVEELLLEEGFENAHPPTGWALAQTGAPDDPGWVRTTTRHTGSYAVYHNDDSTTGDAISWLIMPQLTLPALGGRLRFWQYQIYPTYYTYHGLWVSTASNDPADFVELQQFPAGTAYTWEEISVDLNAYAGQSIYLAFRYVGNYADEWYVDDVSVTEWVEQLLPAAWNLTTDAAGEYGFWLDEMYSPLTVTVSYGPDYGEQVFTGVEIVSGTVTTVNADLIWLYPCVVVTPDALSVSVTMGTTTTLPLNLANLGGVTGTFLLNELSQGFQPLGPLAVGGPDTFGYRYADSNTAAVGPFYAFADISAVGQPLTLGDNAFIEAPIGFDFKFYGANPVTPNRYDRVFVNSNGFLSFGAGSIDISPDPVLPNPTLPNNLIAAAWYDLVPGTVYYQSFAQCPYNPAGTAVDACFIVQYTDFTHKNGSPAGTWEVILFRSGSILLQYADVNAPAATTGIENLLGIDGLTYTPPLANRLAVCFAYPGEGLDCQSDQVPWLDVNVDEGAIPAGGNAPLVVTFDASVPEVSAPGNYRARLLIGSNDPVAPNQFVPVTMKVEMPTTMTRLWGNVYGWGRCDAISQTLAGAQISIQTANGVNQLVTTDAAGAYAVWVEAGRITMTVAHEDYVSTTVVDTVAPGIAPQRDVHLHLAAPCISVTPTGYDVTLPKDRSTTHVLTIQNTGAGNFAFSNIFGSSLWLSVAPKTGVVPAGGSLPVTVTFDATGLAAGDVYSTVLEIVHANPAVARLFVRPVRLTVLDEPEVLVDVVKTADPADFVLPGELITYTVVFTNSYDMPLDLTATDPVPANTTYVLGSVSGATVADPPGNVVTWAGSLEPGASATFSFAVRVNDDVELGTMITNTVTVTANDLPFTAEAVVRVGRVMHTIYLPLVLRNAQ